MEFTIGTTKASQFTVFVNGVAVASTTAGTNQGAGQLILRQTLPLNVGDVLTVQNYTSSAGTVTVSTNAGGLQVGIDAGLVLYNLGPLPADLDPCVVVVENLVCGCERKKKCADPCYEKWGKLYNSYRRYLLHKRDLMVNGSQAFGAFYRSSPQDIAAESALVWSRNINLHNMKHFSANSQIKVCEDGIYKFALNAQTTQPAQFTLFVNGVAIPSTTSGNDTGSNIVTDLQLIRLKKCDVVSVVNHTSSQSPISLQINSGGLEVGFSASFALYKISQLDCDR